MKSELKLQFKFGLSCEKKILRGATTSPLADPLVKYLTTYLLVKRIIKIGDKGKRF